MRKRQDAVRAEREQTLEAMPAVTRQLDGEGVSRMLSEVASRSVLILGRFTETRKPVLDLIRRELSTAPHHYVPILFDFDRPKDRTMVESVLRFAAVSRFVIADLSDPKWVLAELQQVVPAFRSLPVVPIIEATQREGEVIAHFEGYASVHKVVRYRDRTHLRADSRHGDPPRRRKALRGPQAARRDLVASGRRRSRGSLPRAEANRAGVPKLQGPFRQPGSPARHARTGSPHERFCHDR